MPSATLTAPILTALRANPDGLTAKEMAARLEWKATKASFLLGQMFFRNVLERRGGVGPHRMNNEYVYTIREVALAPEVPRLVIAPRIAARIAALASEADRLADMEAV